MTRSGKLAIAGGVGILAALWAVAASAKDGGPVAPPHPKPPGPGEPPPPTDEPPTPNDLTGVENNDYPTPGKFYQVKRGDTFLGKDSNNSIIWRALLSAGYIAATDVLFQGGSDATRFARSFADNAQRRLAYMDLILCLAYNDAAFGVWGWDRQLNRPGPHGRGIPLVPYHVDNRAQLAAGLAVGRNMTLGRPGDTSSSPIERGHTSYPYLFLPALDLNAVARNEIVEADPMDLPFAWAYEAGSLTDDRRFGCGSGTRAF